jgi:hypothetical protein
MAMVDGPGPRDARESAFELRGLHLQLVDPRCGIESTGAPNFPTAVDFLASLP